MTSTSWCLVMDYREVFPCLEKRLIRLRVCLDQGCNDFEDFCIIENCRFLCKHTGQVHADMSKGLYHFCRGKNTILIPRFLIQVEMDIKLAPGRKYRSSNSFLQQTFFFYVHIEKKLILKQPHNYILGSI